MSAILAQQVWRYKLDMTTLVILSALCDIAQDDGEDCYPKPHYVAWKTGAGLSTVYRVIDALVDRGVLIEMGYRGDTIRYRIDLSALELKKPYVRPTRGRPRIAKTLPDGENLPAAGSIIEEGAKSSRSEKNLPAARKIFPQREKSSRSGNQKSPGRMPQTQAASGASETGCAPIRSMIRSNDPRRDDPDARAREEPLSHSQKNTTPAEPEPERPSEPVAVPAYRTIPAASPPTPPPSSAAPPVPTTIGGQEARDVWRTITREIHVADAVRDWYFHPARLFRFSDGSWLLLAHSPVGESQLARYHSVIELLLMRHNTKRGAPVRLTIRGREAVRAQEETLV